MIRALLLCLCIATANAGSLPWHKVGTVKGDCSNYTPVVQMGGSQIRIYSNTGDCGSTNGDYWLRVGSWSSVGSATKVLHIDNARDTFIRTHGVAQGASGTYYAVLYTGDGYPTQGGYSPSWATSPDGYVWTWQGPITIFGRNQSSAAALIVDESRTDAYACMAWLDLPSVYFGDHVPGLYLMHAPIPCNFDQWSSDGLNVWPIANEEPQFVTAAKDQYGYHLMGCKTFPCGAIRHVFSCTGFPPWHLIEDNANVKNPNGKGTNLAVDAPNNLLHALSGGVHFTLPIKAYPC